MTVEGGGEGGGGEPVVGHLHVGHGQARHAVAGPHHAGGAAGDGVGQEVVAVASLPHAGDEDVAGSDTGRILGDAGDPHLGQAAHLHPEGVGEQLGEGHGPRRRRRARHRTTGVARPWRSSRSNTAARSDTRATTSKRSASTTTTGERSYASTHAS